MHLSLIDSVVIKQGNLFLLALRDARLPADEPHPFGLWYRDCRFLSTHEVRLNGTRPMLLHASDAPGTRCVHGLTNDELALGDGTTLASEQLSVHVERALEDPGGLRERIALRSHHREHVRLALDLRLGADFMPLVALRGLGRAERPAAPGVDVDGATVRFSVLGRDRVTRATLVELSEEPVNTLAADAIVDMRFDVELPAGGEHVLELGFVPSESGERSAPGSRRRARPPEPTRISSDDQLFDRVLASSLRDLELLRSELDGRAYFAAGIPWYATLFGRDSLIAAMQMLAFLPDVAEDTLRLLGSLLGRSRDDDRDEEPGKVLHEMRVGELATLGETPFARYYGSVDATPLWLCLLADHTDWSGTLDLFRELRPQVDATLGWIERHGDLDGDGLVEYRSRAPGGLVNQGWKDSPDGVPDDAGNELDPPIALVEVQGYVMRALRRIAALFERDGDHARAAELRSRAAVVEAALERFWIPEYGGYALGLDREKRVGSALTSNQGHLLWAGAVGGERARLVRDLVTGRRMLSGWGIRTLGEGHPRFNPVGYHTGSVWPHDTAMIGHGLRRYGFDDEFTRLFDALLEAASRFRDYRLPELFAGYSRARFDSPVPYPVACAPQAWAAGAIPAMLAAGLGLEPDGLSRRLRIVRPSLPTWVGSVELSGLRVAGARVDLRFVRAGPRVEVADAHVDGDLDVVLETADG